MRDLDGMALSRNRWSGWSGWRASFALRLPFLVSAMVVAMLPSALWGLDPARTLSQYAKMHWQVEQGLPQNYVTSLAQEPGGRLVVGTSGGVARFDGVRFSPVVLDPRTGISREWINAIAVTAAGELWIASRDAGNFVFESGQTRRVQRMSMGPSSAIRRRDGSVVLAGGGGVWQAEGKTLRQLAGVGGGDLSWQGILELPDGTILVCDGAGLFTVGAKGTRLLLPSGGAMGQPLSLAADRREAGNSGRIVYLGSTGGLFRLQLDGAPTLTRIEDVEGPVVSIVEDRDGLLWLATWGKGLYRVKQDIVARWNQEQGLADDFVHTLFEDEEGSLWIGTRAGLSRWHSGPIVPYGPPEGLDALFLSQVAGDRRQGLWIGTWRRGMHQYRDGRFRRLDLQFPQETTLLRAIAFAPDGSAWFSDWAGRLHHRTGAGGPAGEAETVYTSAALGYNASTRAMRFDRKGGLWVGAMEGLYHYPAGSVDGQVIQRLAEREIRVLLESRHGAMWAGSTDGLAAIEGDRIREISGLPHQTVTAIHEDSRGRIWAATRANGVLLVEEDRVRVFDQRHGMPELPVYAILEDRFERLWLSTPAGLFAVALKQFEELMGGGRSRVAPVSFRNEDGLRSIEFQNVGDPSAWRDEDGHLWFATVAGLVEVRPETLKETAPPRLVVDAVRSAKRTHEIAFTTNRQLGAERVEFRYRVEGLQAEWVPIGTQRTLRLDTLPPGEHRIQLASRLNDSAWGEPTTVAITQLPRWFETRWFYAICLTALGVGLWAVYQWRLSLLRARYALVAEERNRIGREWHDTLLAGFSAISWQLDSARKALMAEGERAAEGGRAAEHAIQVAGDMLRYYRTEARRVIWDLRHSSAEREDLAMALRRTLQEILPDAKLARRIEVEGDATQLSAELSQTLLRICQEATFNAARHAEATEVAVCLRVSGSHAEARITDNGKGFDPARVGPGHFGISIMKERASHFGGTVTVESASGKGTTIKLRLPLHGARTA